MIVDLNRLSDMEIVGLTIYGEARGESIEGQVAVGCVIRNRTNSIHHYKDICLAPLQFSCWNHNDPNRALLDELANQLLFSSDIDDPRLSQCLWVADGIINDIIIDNTGNAKNYLTTKKYESGTVQWATQLKPSKVIGNHTFLV